MQFLNDVQQKAGEFAKENATLLLTAGGVVGTVATAILAGRAGFKAAEIIREEELKHIVPTGVDDVIDGEANATMGLSPTQKVKLVWPQFVIPALTGTATVTAIIFSHRMSSAKIAGLAAAYGLAERNFSEYKDKVSEKLTGPKQKQVVDDLAQDRVNRTDGHENIIVMEGEVLCFDEPTGRYFRSTMDKIQKAVNTTNYEIIHHGHANASFFYEELDLPATTWSDEVGWNSDLKLELKITSVIKQEKPCLSIDFVYLPKLDYHPKHF